MKAFIILIALLLFSALNAAPVVSNLSAAQRADASKLVDIYYDVANPYTMNVTLQVSNDNGATWAFSCALVSGDVGANISPGTGKHIVWDVLTEHPDISGSTYKFKVTADDGMPPDIPATFILVAGGTFYGNLEYQVTLSSFYLDKYEITQSNYQDVMGVNPSSSYGVGPNYPVNQVSWLKAIEYCNRRSMAENLVPCYSFVTYGYPVVDYGTNPNNWPAGWETWQNYSRNCIQCAWAASGYRLPTEMEWYFAARGGNLTHDYGFSGSNTITDVAWYQGNSGVACHPVGAKAPNELGLYDMTGNVWEYVWDMYGDLPYSGSASNPTGPTELYPYEIVMRGGAWWSTIYQCAITYRSHAQATAYTPQTGFRVVRKP